MRTGRTLTITDHGRPVARLMPVTEPTQLEQLIAEGLVEPARSGTWTRPRPIAATGTVSDLVSEQRG
ncbi:type II toxin-antitoxin system prevent-host-death family antitoxin [Pseudofrankia sp. DC12]|uniref:type II toxin-antitoxin system Phd/YefM family antitoxin n=1 Tax=Pseudofrankia sp. DC12 TaxID=683315 RepID=UPI000B102088|nr:type II toxin-antitoxin system prevent-host-death family antitoxin [Pseudofrankia sp. DC12]